MMYVPSQAGGMLECAVPNPAVPEVLDDGTAEVSEIDAVPPSVVPLCVWAPSEPVVPASAHAYELVPPPVAGPVNPVLVVVVECVCAPLEEVVNV